MSYQNSALMHHIEAIELLICSFVCFVALALLCHHFIFHPIKWFELKFFSITQMLLLTFLLSIMGIYRNNSVYYLFINPRNDDHQNQLFMMNKSNCNILTSIIFGVLLIIRYLMTCFSLARLRYLFISTDLELNKYTYYGLLIIHAMIILVIFFVDFKYFFDERYVYILEATDNKKFKRCSNNDPNRKYMFIPLILCQGVIELILLFLYRNKWKKFQSSHPSLSFPPHFSGNKSTVKCTLYLGIISILFFWGLPILHILNVLPLLRPLAWSVHSFCVVSSFHIQFCSKNDNSSSGINDQIEMQNQNYADNLEQERYLKQIMAAYNDVPQRTPHPNNMDTSSEP